MWEIKYKQTIAAVLLICFVLIPGCDYNSHSHHSDNDASVLIDEKLETQFALYDEAQDKAIERVVVQGEIIQRDEWESWLTLAADDVITADELAFIAQRQQETIENNRSIAMQSVALDLDLLRNDPQKLEQYCLEFPKGALLHIHPSGTRNRQTVKEILEEVNPEVNGAEILVEANDGEISMLYPDEVEYLNTLPVLHYLDFDEETQERLVDFFFLPKNPPTHDFMRFEAIFSINDLLWQDVSLDAWVEEKTYLDFLHRCAEQNVSYVEFTRVMWPVETAFEQLHTWAEDWYEETGVIVRWNCAFIRTLDYATNTLWAQALIDLLQNNYYPELTGIDLLANETDTPALETGQNIYLPVLAANEEGSINLHRTMHAGELGDIHNVRDAMILGAERVGHGVKLAQDTLALEYAVQEKMLPIEINLYSNYRLQVIDDFSQHPFLNFLRLGLPISLSTDDEGMFVTDIANEYKIAITYTDITHEELKQMAFNSIETAFVDDSVKEQLLIDLNHKFAAFEEKWRQIL
ncbi:MAG: hypothetical protein RBR22_05865 [Desulfuromonas sp.]|nr:hypothetical protein [Desulfuromonas sp.]